MIDSETRAGPTHHDASESESSSSLDASEASCSDYGYLAGDDNSNSDSEAADWDPDRDTRWRIRVSRSRRFASVGGDDGPSRLPSDQHRDTLTQPECMEASEPWSLTGDTLIRVHKL